MIESIGIWCGAFLTLAIFSFLYRDKDHFNSLGSMQLAEPFVEMLRSSGMLSPSD